MLEEIKILLGEAAANFTDAQINLCLKMAIAEVEDYCHRELDYVLELTAQKMTIVKLNRLNTEGLASLNHSGVAENFIDGYPADIQAILKAKRKVKVL